MVSSSGGGSSYIRILRSDSTVLGGPQFVTLIFGEEPPGAGAPPILIRAGKRLFTFLAANSRSNLKASPCRVGSHQTGSFSRRAAEVMLFRNASDQPARVLILLHP